MAYSSSSLSHHLHGAHQLSSLAPTPRIQSLHNKHLSGFNRLLSEHDDFGRALLFCIQALAIQTLVSKLTGRKLARISGQVSLRMSQERHMNESQTRFRGGQGSGTRLISIKVFRHYSQLALNARFFTMAVPSRISLAHDTVDRGLDRSPAPFLSQSNYTTSPYSPV
jgi:hypothetical protein